MKKMGFVIAVSLTFLTSIPAEAVYIRGAPSCGKWIERHNTKSWEELADVTWLVGYLSGIARASQIDILGEAPDNESLTAFVDNYCRKNPLSYADNAADSLVSELRKRKGQ